MSSPADDFRVALKEFLEGQAQNTWLTSHALDVYVRKGFHSIDRRVVVTLDIANIDVHPSYRKQGLAREVFAIARELCPFEALYVENLLSPELEAALQRWGYTRIECGPPFSYYVLTGDQNGHV